jgi:hypothetical protein
MNKSDFRDWYIMLHMGGMLSASTWFMFLHPECFSQWAMFVATVGGIFHWLTIVDDKKPDAKSP